LTACIWPGVGLVKKWVIPVFHIKIVTGPAQRPFGALRPGIGKLGLHLLYAIWMVFATGGHWIGQLSETGVCVVGVEVVVVMML
jgi:hypothetical protein